MKKIVWAWIAATVVVVAGLVGVSRYDWSDQGPGRDATGQFSQQRSGASEAGKHDTMTGKSQSERFDEVTGSLRPVQLNEDQRRRVRELLASQTAARVDTFDYSISIGASVPRQIQLHDLPLELADALGGYHGSKFIVVRDQMVIVDEGRRIVAIVPNVA
jgi:hypothetical protein